MEETKTDSKFIKVGNVYYNREIFRSFSLPPYELKSKRIEALIKKREEDICWLEHEKHTGPN